MKDLAVVVPIYNEAMTLPELWARLSRVLQAWGGSYEVVFVDDGSSDGSAALLADLQCLHPQIVKIVTHRRNFGKALALADGFRQVVAELIVMMDADLQDLPEEIPGLVAALRNGHYDLVNGWRAKRKDPPLKRVASRLYNAVTARLTGVTIHDLNSGLKIFRKEVAEEVVLYGELHRYFIVIAAHLGFRVGEVQVGHESRRAGYSKYGVGRFFAGFYDLLTAIFVTRFIGSPLYLFGTLGTFCILLSAVAIIYYEVFGFYFYSIGDYTSHIISRIREVLAVMGVMIGMLFFGFGLVCQLIVHLLKRPAR